MRLLLFLYFIRSSSLYFGISMVVLLVDHELYGFTMHNGKKYIKYVFAYSTTYSTKIF